MTCDIKTPLIHLAQISRRFAHGEPRRHTFGTTDLDAAELAQIGKQGREDRYTYVTPCFRKTVAVHKFNVVLHRQGYLDSGRRALVNGRNWRCS